MANNPFPDPAAVLPGEAAMLSAVLANLTDDLPKLVYADWLEERGDPRGVFLRDFTTAARNGRKLPTPKKQSEVWLDLVGFRAVTEAKRLKIPLAPDGILAGALPAVAFASKKAKDSALRVGVSKFGGDPDVPAKFKWPEYEDHPLAFVAQFNLSDLSVSPVCRGLPPDGLLSVFYDSRGDVFESSDRGGWKVFLFPEVGALARRPTPDDMPVDGRMNACDLIFTERLTLPERDQPDDEDWVDLFNEKIRHQEPTHQLLGHASWLQGPSDWAERKRAGKLKYLHLLTLDSDDRAGWMWGDSGLLYFGISADDLKAGRFDRTVFEMQCC